MAQLSQRTKMLLYYIFLGCQVEHWLESINAFQTSVCLLLQVLNISQIIKKTPTIHPDTRKIPNINPYNRVNIMIRVCFVFLTSLMGNSFTVPLEHWLVAFSAFCRYHSRSVSGPGKHFPQPGWILIETRVPQILWGPLVEVVVQHRSYTDEKRINVRRF